jgi:hypothetical protein
MEVLVIANECPAGPRLEIDAMRQLLAGSQIGCDASGLVTGIHEVRRPLPAGRIRELDREPVEVTIACVDMAQHMQRVRTAVLEPYDQRTTIDLDAEPQIAVDCAPRRGGRRAGAHTTSTRDERERGKRDQLE